VSYEGLLGADCAQMVISDAPYNVPISGHVSGLGYAQHREFKHASGEMSADVFGSFLRMVIGHVAAFSIDGSIYFLFMDWRSIGLAEPGIGYRWMA
jgi:hypothetical protein